MNKYVEKCLANSLYRNTELIPNKRGEMSELVGATQLCPAGQKMPRLGLSEGGIQTRGSENAI